MENLALWNKVCETDPAITKKAKLSGKTVTAIDAQFQRKTATEHFGPFGIGWGVINEKWDYLDFDETKLCHYTATLWYVLDGERGEFPINANVKVSYLTQSYDNKPGYLKVDDEFAKKVQTNAMTKGLSALGFNSDVFEGKFDDNKYVQALWDKKNTEPKSKGYQVFLETMQAHRARLGDVEYYAILGAEGYEKETEITEQSEALQKRIHLMMKEAVPS